jgi:hypothetical protein
MDRQQIAGVAAARCSRPVDREFPLASGSLKLSASTTQLRGVPCYACLVGPISTSPDRRLDPKAAAGACRRTHLRVPRLHHRDGKHTPLPNRWCGLRPHRYHLSLPILRRQQESRQQTTYRAAPAARHWAIVRRIGTAVAGILMGGVGTARGGQPSSLRLAILALGHAIFAV